jgi:hypothetical protein
VLLPAVLGTATLLVIRYALYLWPAAEYSEPSASKDLLVLVLLLGMAGVIYRPLYAMRQASKAHFLETYVKPNSVLRKVLSGNIWNSAFSATASIVLATIAYVVIQNYSYNDIAMIGLGSAFGLLLSQVVGYLFTDSLKTHVSDLFLGRVRRAILLFCVLTSVLLASVYQDLASPWLKITETQIGPEIKKQVRHPVLLVQQVNRDLLYLNVRVLRARDRVAFPFGWLIYLFLLLPNTIPLYAIACLYLGHDACLPGRNISASLPEK